MPAPDSFLWDDSFTGSDWQESMSRAREDAISRDRGICRYAIETTFSKHKSAERFVLGYPWVDENLNLRREVPAFHPTKQWLYAKNVTSTTFHGPNGTSVGDYAGSLTFGVYNLATIEIEFGDIKYTITSDAGTPTDGSGRTIEYKRWLERKSKPYSEIITIDGGQMKCVAPSFPTLNGTAFFSSPRVLQRVQKSLLTLTWHEVPREFVETPNGRQTKFEAMQKTVNLNTFLDYAPGTLLCEDIDTVVSPSSIATDVLDQQEFLLDVIFTFKLFDPTPADAAVATRGWNLLPAPRQSGDNSVTLTGWFLYTDDGTATGKPLYPSYAFEKAFQHWSLP